MVTTTLSRSDEFTRIFRAEHRAVRDTLLALVTAFQNRDAPHARALLGAAAELAGPHFRYEEEALYPALVSVFGAGYVEHLLAEHDRAIGRAARLVEIAGGDITEEEAREAVEHVRRILPHVSDCDGLSIMVEVLPPAELGEIFDARARSLAEGLPLFEWSEKVRERSLVAAGVD